MIKLNPMDYAAISLAAGSLAEEMKLCEHFKVLTRYKNLQGYSVVITLGVEVKDPIDKSSEPMSLEFSMDASDLPTEETPCDALP